MNSMLDQTPDTHLIIPKTQDCHANLNYLDTTCHYTCLVASVHTVLKQKMRVSWYLLFYIIMICVRRQIQYILCDVKTLEIDLNPTRQFRKKIIK